MSAYEDIETVLREHDQHWETIYDEEGRNAWEFVDVPGVFRDAWEGFVNALEELDRVWENITSDRIVAGAAAAPAVLLNPEVDDLLLGLLRERAAKLLNGPDDDYNT